MRVFNGRVPDADQLEKLGAHGGAFDLVNLLRFREQAAYANGRDAQLSGRDAYARYSGPMLELLALHGAQVVYYGEVAGLVIGQVEGLWDTMVIVRYPSRQAFLEMIDSPRFKALALHRDAGLDGQLNIELHPRR